MASKSQEGTATRDAQVTAWLSKAVTMKQSSYKYAKSMSNSVAGGGDSGHETGRGAPGQIPDTLSADDDTAAM